MKVFIISMLVLQALISTGFACDGDEVGKANYEFGNIQLTRDAKFIQDHRQDLRSEPELESISLDEKDKMNLTATPFWDPTGAKYRLKVEVDAIIKKKSGLRQTNYTVEENKNGKIERFAVTVRGSYFSSSNCNTITKTPL